MKTELDISMYGWWGGGAHPLQKTLTRLLCSIFNWKLIYLPLNLVSTKLTMVSTMITLPWYASLPWEIEAQEHVRGGRGTPPPKNAYPLTIQHIQLKIDIFTCKTGKHDAYQMLTMVSITLTTLRIPWGTNPTHLPKSLTRLQYCIFDWKSIYFPLRLVSITLTMLSIMLTIIRFPWGTTPTHLPETLTAYHTAFSIENRYIYL